MSAFQSSSNHVTPQRIGAIRAAEKSLFVPVVTLVLWLGCVGVGVIGFEFPYSRPKSATKLPDPIHAEILNVELTSEPILPQNVESPPNISQPPPLANPITAPEIPPMLAVAEPTPAIAFALPVERPAQIVDVKQASFARSTESVAPAVAAPSAQPLTFGQGEGKQPAPEYPRQAMRAGQEGTVTIRFSVGENGHVLSAESVSPSPWPLLNEAALRVVRERWRFRNGTPRLYEVSIRFELKK